ncbi:FtsH protease activity modulator HflK [Anaerosporobacter faecicola]|uniref:FtsH protease activity modulator HflK n=1 Tax=Anaerosporobacter faecicola TaxID=2718714 RepID=UPI00143CA0B1|nr:FtsH protease activity modulator HflK [Anaerosporobacter faecicola]
MKNTNKENSPYDKEQKRVLFIAKIIGAAIIVLLLAFNTVYTVSEQEQGVITTLGKATAVVGPGLNFKIPFIQQVHRIDTTIRGFAIGYNQDNNEYNNDESMMITNDFNFVNVDFYVEYKVSNPTTYLYGSEKPIEILKNISQSCIRTVVGNYKVDSVLTDGKSEIQSTIKEMIMDKLDDQDLGLQLVNITIQDAEPPTAEVMQAFKAVETAKQQKETIINNAQKYRNEKLPAAEADVDNILQEANTKKTQRINEAQGQVAMFNAMYKEYVKNPEITKKRMFYEAMEELLPSLEVIIDSGDGSVQKILPLDSFTGTDTSKSSSTTKNSSTSSESKNSTSSSKTDSSSDSSSGSSTGSSN